MLLPVVCSGQELFAIDLEDPDPARGSCFGCAVAIDGDYAFVGEPGSLEGIGGVDPAGEVHVYYRNEGGLNAWGYVQTLVAEDPAELGFGYDLTIANGQIAVLRPTHRQGLFGVPVGVFRAVYCFTFENGTWLRNQIIDDGYVALVQATLCAGRTTSIEGANDRLVVADECEFLRYGVGAPYVEGNAWVHWSEEGDEFDHSAPMYPSTSVGSGRLLALDGDTIIRNYGANLFLTPPYWTTLVTPEIGSAISGEVFEGVSIAAGNGLLLIGVPQPTSFDPEGSVVHVRDLRTVDAPEVQLLEPPPSIADPGFGRLLGTVPDGYLIASDEYLHTYHVSNGILEHVAVHHPFPGDRIAAIASSGTGEMIMGSSNTGSALVYTSLGASSIGTGSARGRAALSIHGTELHVHLIDPVTAGGDMNVIDQLGQVVMSIPLNTGSFFFNIAEWPAGMYICDFPGTDIQPMKFVR